MLDDAGCWIRFRSKEHTTWFMTLLLLTRLRCTLLNVGCWILDVGCWMLDVDDVGCWMLDVGCWMLDLFQIKGANTVFSDAPAADPPEVSTQ